MMTNRKIILLIAFLFIFFPDDSALSLDPREGNGCNVCVKRWSTKGMSWPQRLGRRVYYTTLDENLYPEYAPSHVLPLQQDRLPVKNTTRSYTFNSAYYRVSEADLTSTPAGKDVQNILRVYGESPSHRSFSVLLLDLFQLLDHTFVTVTPFSRSYGAGSDLPCERAVAGIRTDKNLLTLLHKDVWEWMPRESQKILLIHETLRLGQMFSPWMKGFTDDELNHLSMLIYRGVDLREHYPSLLRVSDEVLESWQIPENVLRDMNNSIQNFSPHIKRKLKRQISKLDPNTIPSEKIYSHLFGAYKRTRYFKKMMISKHRSPHEYY